VFGGGITVDTCLQVVIKDKVLPYSLPSIGPRADPGVQAVNPQVTLSHPPGGRLPLLSARPAVTFVAFTRWHHIVAHIRFKLTTHLMTQKEWKAELAWLADLQQTVYPQKWLPISCRSGVGQGKFAGHRLTFCSCATQQTRYLYVVWIFVTLLQVGVQIFTLDFCLSVLLIVCFCPLAYLINHMAEWSHRMLCQKPAV